MQLPEFRSQDNNEKIAILLNLVYIPLISIAFIFSSWSCRPNSSDWGPTDSPLFTRWAKEVSPENALPEYPRPQMLREDWLNLNGLWDLAITGKDEEIPSEFNDSILVPFPIESALSGVRKRVDETHRIWYRRSFKIPPTWKKKRILLHFGAVDWETAVFVNGEKLGAHRGGYDAFSFDITATLQEKSIHELVVSVWDPSDRGTQPAGKQRIHPRGIFYTPTSGIWRTVWLEPVPETYIKRFRMIPDVNESCLYISIEVEGDNEATEVQAVALDQGEKIATATGNPREEIKLPITEPRMWSPESPFLYDLELTLRDVDSERIDQVDSYFAMRKIEVAKDEKGISRIFFNNEFVFQLGPLDQGFWPDGLYTAPTDEALRFDIEIMKKMGFNMVRKHVKIEPDRWYYWCDKLGLLVWQDMPNGRNESDADKKQFELELERMILGLYNHPSIVMWVPFNEGWGQYDTERITQWITELDPSRLVNQASGWHDREVGDVHDIHSYPDPKSPEPEPKRAAVLGEFGGLGFNVQGHSWNEQGWGYDLLQDPESLVLRYENLFWQLFPLIVEPGLSAAVYTQITDIESENNGLLTYDREANKIAPEYVALANEGYLPPRIVSDVRIFIDEFRVKLSSLKPKAVIYYTMDGNDPTAGSTPYSGPFVVKESTALKARAFWDDGKVSRIGTFLLAKVSPKRPVQVTNRRPGLKTHYFEGQWEKLPDFNELNPSAIEIQEKFDLSTARRDDYYGLRFEGYISVPQTGVYVFYTASDDGSRLFIGDEEVVDNDGLHGEREKKGAVALEAGFHPITLLFFQRAGGKMLRVSYQGPGLSKQEIPAASFLHK